MEDRFPINRNHKSHDTDTSTCLPPKICIIITFHLQHRYIVVICHGIVPVILVAILILMNMLVSLSYIGYIILGS
jgi:hypothetical protein